MKLSGVVLAIAAAMPLGSAVPFRMGDLISGITRCMSPSPLGLGPYYHTNMMIVAAAPEPATVEVEVAPRSPTTRSLNETEVVSKRSVNLEGVERKSSQVPSDLFMYHTDSSFSPQYHRQGLRSQSWLRDMISSQGPSPSPILRHSRRRLECFDRLHKHERDLSGLENLVWLGANKKLVEDRVYDVARGWSKSGLLQVCFALLRRTSWLCS
jgi:hypothetical protein